MSYPSMGMEIMHKRDVKAARDNEANIRGHCKREGGTNKGIMHAYRRKEGRQEGMPVDK